MILVICIISVSFMVIGAIAFALLNKKSSIEKSKERNTKLIIYILMVFLVYASIAYFTWLLYIIMAILILISTREIINAASVNGKQPYVALLIAGIILYFFARFIKETNFEVQLFTYFIVVHFDGFSQVIGESFGNRKIFPKISPQKTWIGFLGGLLIAFIACLLLFYISPHRFIPDLGEMLLLTGIIIISGFIGDILASWYKRYCGIRNYSNMIPGHGGVLDRFDSFFMAGAVLQVLQSFYSQS